MDSKDLIKAGNLSDAYKQLITEVKSSPADAGKRTLLFQVLSFCGEWDKAERHLDLIAAQDPVGGGPGAQVYKSLILAEKERVNVFKRNNLPSFLPETPQYFNMYNAALDKLGENKIDEAKGLFDRVNAQRPDLKGTVNGKEFTGFEDTDSYVSIFLEAIVHEHYIWIPFETIKELIITPPKTLFDLIWVMANITTWEGLTMSGFLPVLYYGSSNHEDDRIKLGRMTDWSPLGGPFSKATGQHVYQIGEEDVPILEIREVLFKASNVLKEEKDE